MRKSFFSSKMTLTVFAILAVVLSNVSPILAADKHFQRPGCNRTTYRTVPITMQMEAGKDQYSPHPSGGFTIHAGVGWLMPFGKASYVAGKGYPEAVGHMPSYMWQDDGTMNPSWQSLFDTSLFCIYSLPDGDIYAWDGIMGNLEPNEDDDGKMDYLINVIVGGTGRYKNANGILLGRTPGRGAELVAENANTPFPLALPSSILKIMEGYINLEVKRKRFWPKRTLPLVGTKNPQKWPGAILDFDAGEIIPINIEMEAGRSQWNDYGSGTTIVAGIGWVEPFGRAQYHYGYGYDEDTPELRPDFMDDPSWSKPYHTNNLCVYHLAEGDIYTYDGIVGNLAHPTRDGRSDYIVEVVVGGTGEFAYATGMILGYKFCRGETEIPVDPENDEITGPYPLPDSIIKIMEGYIIKKSPEASE